VEHGSSFGTYLAYGAISLFWLIILLVVLRTMMFMALLLVQPVRDLWAWRGGAGRNHRPAPPRDEPRGSHAPDESGPSSDEAAHEIRRRGVARGGHAAHDR
jgi:hypothetical protein